MDATISFQDPSYVYQERIDAPTNHSSGWLPATADFRRCTHLLPEIINR
jgi:hypothetical protein